MKFIKLFILALMVAGLASCKKDEGSNPVFGPDEVYIYTNSTSFGFTQGTTANIPMLVSPNDGSINFRWSIDGVVISTERDLVYIFTVPGAYRLRFETNRGNFTNFREFSLTVYAATAP